MSKETGYFNVVSQNQDNSFIYTFLEEYKKDPVNAQPYLVITFFNELLFKKGIVLIRGDIVNELNQEESKRLLNMTIDFYTKEMLLKKVVDFNQFPRNFNFDNHIKDCLNRY